MGYSAFSQQNRPLIAAINGENSDFILIKSALDLAVRVGMPLNIVLLETESTQKTEQHLAALQKEFARFWESTFIKILEGNPVKTLLKHCESVQASALIVGGAQTAETKSKKIHVQFLDNLMNDAKLPVIVLPHADPRTFSADPLRILIADNMDQKEDKVLEAGIRFASLLGEAEVEVAYVGDYKNFLAQAEFLEVYTESSGMEPPELDSDDLSKYHREKQEAKFRNHVQSVAQELHLDLPNIQCRLLDGKVLPALQAECKKFDPNIVIFGKHHHFHHRLLPFGSVNTEDMLSFRRPIMVASPSQ